MKGEWFLEEKKFNKKMFYYSNDDDKAEGDCFKPIWVDWTHECR